MNIYQLCQKEAKKCKRHLTVRDVDLIKAYIGKNKIGLLSKTDIVASYIGRGVIQDEAQLKGNLGIIFFTDSVERKGKVNQQYFAISFVLYYQL